MYIYIYAYIYICKYLLAAMARQWWVHTGGMSDGYTLGLSLTGTMVGQQGLVNIERTFVVGQQWVGHTGVGVFLQAMLHRTITLQ
jgi:hypothetical protein